MGRPSMTLKAKFGDAATRLETIAGTSGTLPHAFRKMTICSSMHDFDCFHLSLGYDFARSTQPAGCRNNLFLRDAGVRRGAEALTQGA
jgi:hypothetical protein